MVFSSSLFLVYFFPIFLLVYFLVKKEFKNIVALLASILFYAFGGKLFTILLLVTVLADFKIVERMVTSKGEEKKFLFWLSIILNLGLLAYFKYANFFVENINAILGGESSWTKVVLPIGISFFTFQKMSYTFDVYRGTHKPLNSFVDYALYILLFPQLIAGPIVRYNEIADELVDREKNETIDNRILGFFRFAIGLGKKILIANVLGETANNIFNQDASTLSMSQAWIGALMYAFHIYFDFSGYSDMAIGIGRMIGFKFPENFNFPFIAQNITEFWQRWHITLSRWMRDYLYIPLGGNRVSKNRMFVNLAVVFLLSGLWHGASWNFVIWGGFHGVFLILDRLFLIEFNKKIGKIPSIILTFIITLVGWVIFASKDITQIESFLLAMVGAGKGSALVVINIHSWIILLFAILFSSMPLIQNLNEKLNVYENLQIVNQKQAVYFSVVTFVIISISLCYVAGSGFNPFIYFRF
jgi:alginate O-acetyltransferase complex protein AlgI